MPRIEHNNEGKNAFASKKNKQPVEGNNMTESANTPEVAEQKNNANSPVSIADLYTEMEQELSLKTSVQNTGVTARIRELVEQIFDSTGKEKLLLSAVVKICEKQEGRTKMYNLVRSIGNSRSEHAKFGLIVEEGRTYITRK